MPKKKTEQQIAEEYAAEQELFETQDDGVTGLPDSDFETDLFASEIKWNPEEIGESLTGVYRGIKTVENPNAKKGDTKQFLVGMIEHDSGEIYSVSGHALINKLLPMYPVGVKIRIVYVGNIKVKQPSPMKNFRVDVFKADKAKVEKYRKDLQGDSPNLPF